MGNLFSPTDSRYFLRSASRQATQALSEALVNHIASHPTRAFGSGAILVYLAEEFDALLTKEPAARAECMA